MGPRAHRYRPERETLDTPTGPQMRPRTAEPVAGAAAWARARWATLREAPSAGPKQPDLITAGRDTHTHTHTCVCDHQKNPYYSAKLSLTGSSLL